MKLKKAAIILLIILAAGIANAEEEVKSFSGSGEAGLLMTSGNSETDSVNAKLGLKYEKDHLLGEVNLGALYRSETTEVTDENNIKRKEDKVSAEKYNYSAKVGYKFNPANSIFVNGDYEDDRFSGYDYKTTYSIGYGRKMIDNDTVKLDIEIGPGYRYNRTNGYWENGVFIDEKTEDEAVFRGYAMFNYKFSEAVSFQQDVTVIIPTPNPSLP